MTPNELPHVVAEIGERIRTQDNRITSHPVFVVEQKRKICGLDDGYADGWEWYDPDACEVYDDAEKAARDAEREADGSRPVQWRHVGYVEIWEFVTACFTEQGCKDYIAANGHNLREPRIYAHSGYRNAEWQAMREYLSTLTAQGGEAVDHATKMEGWYAAWNDCQEIAANTSDERIRSRAMRLLSWIDDNKPTTPPGPSSSAVEGLVARLQKTVSDLGEHRQTHVVWRDWLQKSPDNEKVNPHAGSAEFHAGVILDYDRHLANINDAIQALASTAASGGGKPSAPLDAEGEAQPGPTAPPPSTPAEHYLASTNGVASREWHRGFNACAEQQVPWIRRWEGSGTQRGFHILDASRLTNHRHIAYLGDHVSSEAVDALINEHNATLAHPESTTAPAMPEGLDLKWLNRLLLQVSTEASDVETASIAREQAAILRAIRNVPAKARQELSEDDVQWVVNDNAELGVKIGSQFFWMYKGRSLIYEDGLHDDGTPMHWRPVFKREFGECCHPVNYEDLRKCGYPHRIGEVSLDDSEEWEPLAAASAQGDGDGK